MAFGIINVMLSITMLSITMLSVILLIVVAPKIRILFTTNGLYYKYVTFKMYDHSHCCIYLSRITIVIDDSKGINYDHTNWSIHPRGSFTIVIFLRFICRGHRQAIFKRNYDKLVVRIILRLS